MIHAMICCKAIYKCFHNFIQATCGLSVNPHDEHRFACYGDDCIAVWDSRTLSKPNAIIPVTNRISKVTFYVEFLIEPSTGHNQCGRPTARLPKVDRWSSRISALNQIC